MLSIDSQEFFTQPDNVLSLSSGVNLLETPYFFKQITLQNALEATSFALEEHLREYLKNNLHAIEPGLRLFKDKEGKEGIEYQVDASRRRIDILAIDKTGIPVIVELKVSRGHEKALGQALYYRGRAKQLLSSSKARIVVVAREIIPELMVAAEGLPEVELFQYKLSFKLEKL